MFTGIITDLAEVKHWDGATLEIAFHTKPSFEDYDVGSSIALDGVCLTVIAMDGLNVTFEVMPETVEKTRLQSIQQGDYINVEFPMAANGRFEGHVVQGHVDGLGELVEVTPDGNSHVIKISVPESLMRYVVPKGSVTVNGISLTVVETFENAFTLAIIPHTWEVTNIGKMKVGDKVNVEVDIMAKYLEKMVSNVTMNKAG